MTDKAPKPAIRFLARMEEHKYAPGDEYLIFIAEAVIDGRNHAGEAGLYDPDSCELPGYDPVRKAFKGLVITAQADTNSLTNRPGNEFYGWQVGYERRRVVEVDDMEAMVGVLRKIRTGMRKRTDDTGRPATLALFATYAARSVTPAKAPFFRRARDSEAGWTENGYIALDTDGLAYFIHNAVAEWRKARGIEVSQ